MNKTKRLGYVEKIGTRISWSIVISSIVLLIVVIIFFLDNLNREKKFMKKLLLEKGITIIKAFEASTRTGLLQMGWESFHIQKMISAMGNQNDVVYIFICNKQGRALAHTDPNMVGKIVISPQVIKRLRPGIKEKYRITYSKDNKKIFEVYKVFKPIHVQRAMCPQFEYRFRGGDLRKRLGRNGTWCSPYFLSRSRFFVFVGLDISPFKKAQDVDTRNAVVISIVIVLLGMGGIYLSNLVVQYQRARGKLSYTSAVADTVISNLPVGLMVLSRDGRIIFINREAAKIIDQEADSILGKRLDEKFTKGFVHAVSALNSNMDFVEKEVDIITKGGSYQPATIIASKIISEYGDHIGDIVIIKDLKEIKKLQEEIQRKERLASLGRLAAGIAHEIRNPLSSIKGMATYYIQKFSDQTEEGKIGKILVQEVNRLNRVISELLDFAKPVNLNLRETRLKDLVNHALRLISEDAREKNINIHVGIEPDELSVVVDPDRFIQCLLNLFINSLESMDKDGVLSIVGRVVDEKQVLIQVIDSGKGIDKKDLTRIFDPYFTTKPFGTGLGLAIVHKIVEAHGGKIEVISNKGQGTVFSIFLKAKV